MENARQQLFLLPAMNKKCVECFLHVLSNKYLYLSYTYIAVATPVSFSQHKHKQTNKQSQDACDCAKDKHPINKACFSNNYTSELFDPSSPR